MQRFAGASLCSKREKVSRKVYAVDAKAGFGEQMRVAPLTARRIQDACIDGKTENLDEPACLSPITLRSEDRGVLQKIL